MEKTSVPPVHRGAVTDSVARREAAQPDLGSIEPARLARLLCDHGKDWADKNAAAELMEETRKTLKSQIASQLMEEHKSVAKAELYAEASDEYVQHIRKMVDARKEANRARIQYDADKAFIELIRSQESTNRALINLR